MFARSTTPSLIVIGTSQSATVAALAELAAAHTANSASTVAPATRSARIFRFARSRGPSTWAS